MAYAELNQEPFLLFAQANWNGVAAPLQLLGLSLNSTHINDPYHPQVPRYVADANCVNYAAMTVIA